MRQGAISKFGQWVPNRRACALGGVALACAAGVSGGAGALAITTLISLASLLILLRDDSRVRALASHLGATRRRGWSGSVWSDLTQHVAALEARAQTFESRLPQRHSATGLPTREPLIARIEQDKRGLLSVIVFA